MDKASSQRIEPVCSFCNRPNSQVQALIAGPVAAICDECIALAQDSARNQIAMNRSKSGTAIPTPRQICDYLDQYVIGQDNAKRTLAVGVHNHYVRLDADPEIDGVELSKSNILLIGPTGSGKTHIASSLARMLDVPFAMADATTLTEAGYVGEDVESIITKLLMAADYDVSRAQRGIIYIDEIDKISRRSDSPSITRDVSGEGVQQALLKLIEGYVANVTPQGGRKNPEQPTIQVDTSKILFICGGAFAGLDRMIAARVEDKSIGFGASVDATAAKRTGELLAAYTPEDLTRYGLIPEFVGRLPVVATLQDLDIPALKSILTTPRNALVKQYQCMFQKQDVALDFDDEALTAIAEAAIKEKTGARGLRTILERLLLTTMFELPDIAPAIGSIKVWPNSVTLGDAPERIARNDNDQPDEGRQAV